METFLPVLLVGLAVALVVALAYWVAVNIYEWWRCTLKIKDVGGQCANPDCHNPITDRGFVSTDMDARYVFCAFECYTAWRAKYANEMDSMVVDKEEVEEKKTWKWLWF